MGQRTVVAAILLVVGMGAVARAEVKTNKYGQVSIDVPSTWKIGGQGDIMTISDPTNEVGILFWVVDAAATDKAIAILDAQMAKVATDVKWNGKPEKATINGMSGIVMDGTAAVKGKPAATSVVILGTPNKKALIVLAMVEAGKEAAHKAELVALVQSLKPAAP